ncbi:NADPH:quinone reductase [candidate division TA06 bacterium DG_24]|uniref:NADPH:quinone reductase n=3 Tax=Bacteria division TA06 TaxID=1156500 RepID=A0A0S8JG78_UNCT6|nr:MAG: NADPH:quinone reductase [candidate division TA06 bacterium DG_24]KPK66082.1 MAG: NADPH:quinone reductase [candidate division TA06 bacterium SM23_40]KPL07836.1 MAG: NADPH:quinone reductase [candidate division TA06 bacterium SM1_40]
MYVYVVFAHPSKESFTWEVLGEFVRGLEHAGHSVEIGDLYEMEFKSDMDLDQYKRETALDPKAPVPEDVKAEQSKIDKADGLAFVYPVWWSDCPAKLKGWFDRVLTYGYAYLYADGEHVTSRIDVEKALVVCPAGHTVEHLEEIGIAESMRRIMINDRLLGVGVKQAKMEILGGMVGGDAAVRKENLERAYELGRKF